MDDKEQNTAASENVTPGAEAPRDLKSDIIEVLKTCYDPEIPVDIYELGLIYKIEPDPSGSVVITMTLTSPMCPVAGSLPLEVENKVAAIDGVTEAKVELVWDPPWDPDKMTEAARLELGMM
jgi:FeS assembly SUF system protein